jgi:arsenate reductase
MADVTVFEKPTCTTCRNLFVLLTEKGIDADRIDYQVTGLSREQLDRIVKLTGLTPRELLRTREPEYKELGLDDPATDGETILAAMVQHPALLQRPVVVRGDKAVLARPVEKVFDLF